MPLDLGNPTWLEIVADGSTPPEVLTYVGIRIPVPENITLPTLGVQDTLTVSGITVHGYVRDDGSGGYQWLLTPAVDPNIAALSAIPGVAGWTSTTARDVYASLGGALLGMGVPGASVRSGFKQLYDAAITNFVAAVAAGTIAQPPGP